MSTTADHDLDLELAYTPAATACRDPYSPTVWCRRAPRHDGPHAAGHGTHRIRWQTQPTTEDRCP